jgi:hypothetical protein
MALLLLVLTALLTTPEVSEPDSGTALPSNLRPFAKAKRVYVLDEQAPAEPCLVWEVAETSTPFGQHLSLKLKLLHPGSTTWRTVDLDPASDTATIFPSLSESKDELTGQTLSYALFTPPQDVPLRVETDGSLWLGDEHWFLKGSSCEGARKKLTKSK